MAQLLKQRMTEATLRIPFHRETLDELNVEKYELTKTGRITFSHPHGTHDDRFWALAQAVYSAEQAPHLPSRLYARAIYPPSSCTRAEPKLNSGNIIPKNPGKQAKTRIQTEKSAKPHSHKEGRGCSISHRT